MADQYGDVIRRLRRARRWSQTELVSRSKVSRETVSRAEASGNVGILLLQQIAHALDVDISALFDVAAPTSTAQPPAVWDRLTREQREQVDRYAHRVAGERAPARSRR